MGSPERKAAPSQLATNRKARHDYHVLDRIEAGIELRGTEVKSLRAGHANLTGAYACAEGGQMWLHNLSIPAYEFGNQFNHTPDRVRRLLLHKREIERLGALVEQQGQTLVPLGLYLKKGRVKVDLGVCKGKTHGDQRETLRRRQADRDARRDMAARK